MLPALTTKDFALSMYSMPLLSATNAPSSDEDAGAISLAPSRTRTPRYSYLPPEDLQIATREVCVLPNMTAVAGAEHRAVEST